MTAAWHAAVVLAWIAIVILALGYAAILREVRELSAGAVPDGRGTGRSLVVAPGLRTANPAGTLALAATATCASCRTVTDALSGHVADDDGPDLRLVTADERVLDWPSSAALRPLVDADLWDRLAVQSTPILLRITPDGTVAERSIVGSPEHLAELIDRAAAGRAAASNRGGTS